jgi:hypothetical protein
MKLLYGMEKDCYANIRDEESDVEIVEEVKYANITYKEAHVEIVEEVVYANIRE